MSESDDGRYSSTKRERRNNPRMDVTLTVRLKARNFQNFFEQVAGDISVSGVFLPTDDPRPLGTEVNLVIHLEVENQEITVAGVVVRSITPELAAKTDQKPGMAIRFTHFSNSDDKALAWLLKLHEITHRDKGQQQEPAPE